jgi:curved DNA-binding protein CbpA
MTTTDPFAALGLPARPDLTDEQVRAAWRAVAARTHPDRPGGGNPAVYAAASAAYATLRTPWGRSEAYADLATRPAGRRPRARPAAPGVNAARALWLVPARIRHGRLLRLVLRILTAVVLALVAAASGAGGPAAAGVAAGLAVWLVITGRADLAPPPGR